MAAQLETDFSFYDVVPELSALVIVDVGAQPLKNQPEIYAPLVEIGKAEIVAFEANAEGCSQLTEVLGAAHSVREIIIGDGSPATFHRNKSPVTNSLFPANMALLSRFSGLAEMSTLVSSENVQTYRLDDLIDLPEIDFLKMDVQGGELNVLNGASRVAGSAMAIHTEVEFVPLYIGQPLFADIDIKVRSLDFQFHTLSGPTGRVYKPLQRAGSDPTGVHQYLWSDAVYIPDLSKLERHSAERILKLCAILHDIYHSFDLVLHLLLYLKDREDVGVYGDYCKKLGLI
ncbi:MAG: FkbM family methyltransferase [Rhodospirillaceae bacterium]